MSVLDPMGTVSAGIYANEELDLLILELSWLGKLFETERTYPVLQCVCVCVCNVLTRSDALAERFYKHLASKLARRLQQAGGPKKPEESLNSSKNAHDLVEVLLLTVSIPP